MQKMYQNSIFLQSTFDHVLVLKDQMLFRDSCLLRMELMCLGHYLHNEFRHQNTLGYIYTSLYYLNSHNNESDYGIMNCYILVQLAKEEIQTYC